MKKHTVSEPKKILNFFEVISENPELLIAYFDKMEKLMKNDTLPILTKEFISIGAAVAAGSEHCLNTHIEVAREFGLMKKYCLQF